MKCVLVVSAIFLILINGSFMIEIVQEFFPYIYIVLHEKNEKNP